MIIPYEPPNSDKTVIINSQPPPSYPPVYNGSTTVTIRNARIKPKDITIIKGTTVTFDNQDSLTHEFDIDDGSSGKMYPGTTWNHTFNSYGVFYYYSATYPQVDGTISVVSGAST